VCFTLLERLREAGGFDIALTVAADHELFARIVKAGGVARRVPVAIARYEGGGFSSRSNTQQARLADIAEIRRRHYSRFERLLFGGIWALTLPLVRRKLLALNWVRPLYAKTVNTAYLLTDAFRRVVTPQRGR
jgi:hypothetical protein